MSDAITRVIIDKSALSSPPQSSRGTSRFWLTCGFIAIGVLLLIVELRSLLERAALTAFVARTIGAPTTIGDVHDALGALWVERVHVDGGSTLLDVPLVEIRFGNPLTIAAHSPQISASLGDSSPDLNLLGAAVAWLRHTRASVAIDHGSVRLATATLAPESLEVRQIDAQVSFDAIGSTYDVRAKLAEGAQTYPLLAHGVRRAGEWHDAFSAPALPVAAFAPFLAPGVFVPTGGELQGVSISRAPTLRVHAILADVDARLGRHRIWHLSGPLDLRADRLGTVGIVGKLDDASFSLAGELHDCPDPITLTRASTPQIRELGRLVTMVADQPAMRSVQMEVTAPGVTFAHYTQDTPVGPRAISLVVMDPKEPSLKFGTAISSDHVISKGERTSQIAQRSGAVAAVNGDYFDIGRSYEPQGLYVHDGAIVRGPTDRAAVLIDRANNVTFAEFHLNGRAVVRGRSYPVTQVNTWPPGHATVITPEYGTKLRPAPGTTFARLSPIDLAAHEYRVTSVEAGDTDLRVSFGLGFGPLAAGADPRVGDQITLTYALTPSVKDVVAGIGGGPILLKDGAWYEDPHPPAPDERDVRWPVVAVAATVDGFLVLAAVDGRHPTRAVGMTRPEFAALLQSYGVRDAMALDSGGSVTLVARAPGSPLATVRNTPSDDSAERYISDALLVFSSASPDEIVTPAPSPAPTPVR